MSEGAGDGSGRATGVKPGALSALLQEVAAAPEIREEEPHSLPPGEVVGRFEIVRELGRGGFGVVYEAKDRDLGRQVAVKVVRPGRIVEEEGKVSREAEAIARLSHPNLITLFEVGRSEHGPFLVFELLRGKTLDLRIEEGPLPVQEAVHIATEVSRGLAHAHAEGVTHRDLKPANVFVTNKGQVRILDFGLAHAFGRRRLSGGTPAYMAPEQWEDAPEDERTDVFALGVMLYRMLSGEYPFPEGEGTWAAEGGIPRKLDVPGAPEVADLVGKMLDPVPTHRPRDGEAVLAALAPIDERLRARPADGKPPEQAKRRKATFGDLLTELKRRRVFQVMVGYGIFSFAVLQIIEPIMHGAELPDWTLKAVLVALALGFPVAVVLAWVYDLTSQGVKRTPSASGPGAPSFRRSRLLIPLAMSAVLLVLAAIGAGGWHAWKRASEPGGKPGRGEAGPSVAVLSFADLSPGHDQEYLADGVAEEVLNGLAQVDGLRVVGRSTAFSLKGKGKRVEEIGKELGVAAVLEGSVRTSGDRVRITAQLLRTRDASALWSQTFERNLSDVFAVQDEIGRAVVEALAVRLLPGRSVARAGGSTSQEALQLYMRGRDILRRGGDGAPRGLEAFERAVKVDPGFALAWVGIADAIVTLEATMGDYPGDVAARRRRAREAADTAVRLAPGLADALRARADVRQWLEADWAGQREDLERARALAPGDLAVAMSKGWYLLAVGRVPEADAEFERVTRDDPLLERGWVNGWLGVAAAAYSRRDHERARSASRRAEELFPGFRAFWLTLIGMDMVVAGEPSRALEVGSAIRLLGPYTAGFADMLEALAYHDLGRADEARRARDELVRRWGDAGANYQVAEVFAWQGDADGAFAWLEKARALPDTALFWMKTDPLLDRIRGDPRWPKLLERAGLPPDGAATTVAIPSASAPGPSVAVLPFADMSPKHDQEYLADGVAEEIRNALARVDGLKVIGRTSSSSFKGRADDVRTIGQKLGVANVLEGSLRKDGKEIRVTAQLTRVADGAQLWSGSYDRKLEAILKVQEQIAAAVVGGLKVKLLPQASGASAPGRAANAEAYRLHLLARSIVGPETPEARLRAAEVWERATQVDPGYALPHVFLAINFGNMSQTAADPAEALRLRQRARSELERAIAIDPNEGAAYGIRAWWRMSEWDWTGAKRDLDRAEALRADPAVVHNSRARLLAIEGRYDEALAAQRRTLEFEPLGAVFHSNLVHYLIGAGRLQEAREALKWHLELSQSNDRALEQQAILDLLEGRPEKALPVFERLQGLPQVRLRNVAVALHALGREEESRAALAKLERDHADERFLIAGAHASRGDRDGAMQWLQEAFDHHDPDLTVLRVAWPLRPVRDDPRFRALLRKMNLPVD